MSLWTSKRLGAASVILVSALGAEMASLEVLRPRMPQPENGFILAEGTRIGRHLITFYVSRLDMALELALVAATIATTLTCLDLRRRGR